MPTKTKPKYDAADRKAVAIYMDALKSADQAKERQQQAVAAEKDALVELCEAKEKAGDGTPLNIDPLWAAYGYAVTEREDAAKELNEARKELKEALDDLRERAKDDCQSSSLSA